VVDEVSRLVTVVAREVAHRGVDEDVHVAVLRGNSLEAALYILGVREIHPPRVNPAALKATDAIGIHVAGYGRCVTLRQRADQRAPQAPCGTGDEGEPTP
jgi:hypothetical protein